MFLNPYDDPTLQLDEADHDYCAARVRIANRAPRLEL